jgi:3,4-dihydroxyphenylacetate 2,3-dioxygenase
MGQIVGAALVSHVPTLVLPETTRRELNGGVDTTLHAGLHQLRRDRLDVVTPDTIVVFDGHWATTVETVVTAHAHRSGRYTSDELPRGMSAVPYEFPGDPALAGAFAAAADRRDDAWVTAIDDPYLPIHYGTVNLLPFLQGDERWVSVSVVQTGEVDDYMLAGTLLAEAIASVDRRVVLLASGGLSHRFWPLREFRQHEGADPALHLRSPEARAADERVLGWLRDGDHRAVIDFMPEFAAFAPEARFGPYLMMAGALGGADWQAKGTQFGDYEAVAGTGQAHVWFEV